MTVRRHILTLNCATTHDSTRTMLHYKLILYPALMPIAAPDTEMLVMALKNGGLIADDILNNNYPVGNAFLALLSFLGCAPTICLSPAEGDNACQVAITPWQPCVHYLGHSNNALPRCPHCKTRLPHWQQTTNWQLGATTCICPHCHTTTAMQHLNWKREGAYGCMAVEITNIHPFEAVPSENLLQILQAATGVEWDYCYASNAKQLTAC